jgi:hypothetical protein
LERFIIGVDLGQASDYTAISVLERVPKFKEDKNAPINYPAPIVTCEYHLRWLERIRHKSYIHIVDRLKVLTRHEEVINEHVMLVDSTGVGRGIMDIMNDERMRPIGITIHAGNRVSDYDGGFNIPKRDLVGSLQVLFQTGRIKIPQEIELIDELVAELQNFRVKFTQTGHDTYEAWRENDHDDLVLSLSMAAWYAAKTENSAMALHKKQKYTIQKKYNPFSTQEVTRVVEGGMYAN